MEWYYIVWNILAFIACSIGVWLWWTKDESLDGELQKSFTTTVIIFSLFGYLTPVFAALAVIASPFWTIDWLAKKWRGK